MIWPFSKKETLAPLKSEPQWLIAISTSNFDEMVGFFRTLMLDVRKGEANQLCPAFNEQRGASIWLEGSFVLNVEENTSISAGGNINLMLESEMYTEDKLEKISQELNQRECHETLYGTTYVFKTPDSGLVSVGVSK